MAHIKLSLLLFLATAASQVHADWPNLRTTWGVPGIDFHQNPRTEAEVSADWIMLSSCDDGASAKFPGNRYVQSLDDDDQNDIVLIFDVNGYIAGIQNVVPLDKTLDDQYYAFSANGYYQTEDFGGTGDVYYLTAYFVDPALICTVGRTEEEFEEQGTGYMLAFQNGETSDSVLDISLDQQGSIDGGVWYEHNCFFDMGVHFFPNNHDENEPCDDGIPFQLVYHNGHLNGFVFNHIANLDGSDFEVVNSAAINAIMDRPPSCLFDLVDQPGISTLHVYVDEYIIVC